MKFKLHGSMINDVSLGYMKSLAKFPIFFNPRMPIKLKRRFHDTVIRPGLPYGSESWTMDKSYENKLIATEMKILRMADGLTKRNKIQRSRTSIHKSLHAKNTIAKKIEKDRLNCCCHIQRRNIENPVEKTPVTNVSNSNPASKTGQIKGLVDNPNEQKNRTARLL